MSPLETVIARRAELQKLIVERSAVDPSTETDVQRAEWDAALKEDDELAARQSDLEGRIARAEAASKNTFNVPNVNTRKSENPAEILDQVRNIDTVSNDDLRGRALEVVERSASKFDAAFGNGNDVARLIERGGLVGRKASLMALTNSSDEYTEAWKLYMSGKQRSEKQNALLERALDVSDRAFTSGTGSSGGYMTPLFLDPTMVITGAGAVNPIREMSTVKQIATLTWNSSTAAQISAGYLSENSAFSDNTPTVSAVVIPTYKAGAYLPASFEAFEDIDALAQDAVMLFADAKNIFETTALTTDNGSSKATGVSYAVGAVTASRVAPKTGGTFGAPDIFTVHTALPARYRKGGGSLGWIANVGVIDAARQFGTSNVYYAYLANGTQGDPDQLLGKALYEDSAMSGSLTTGQDVLLFGDFSKYYIIDRIGATTEFIPNVFDQATGRPSGTRAWLMHWRFGANVADANAFRQLRL